MNYKMPELYDIYKESKNGMGHINDLFSISNEYCARATALISLCIEVDKTALKERKGISESDMLDSMYKVYDYLPEEAKKEFCQDMLNKKQFFEDALSMITDCLQNTLEEQKEIVETDIEGKEDADMVGV